MPRPLKIFITYSHADKTAKDELVRRLAVMIQNDEIIIWHDNEIRPGDKWREEISNKLHGSDILLYLTSAASLASENCNKELTEALGATDHRIRTIPVILEPCDWQRHQLSKMQALPESGKPIAEWTPPSKGWQNVVDGIHKIVDEPCPDPSLKDEDEIKFALHQLYFTAFLLGRGHWKAAAEYLSDIIEVNPKSDMAYNDRGVAKYELGQHEEAIKDCDEAIKLNPRFAMAYNNRGNAKRELGDCQGALVDYTEAIRLDPRLPNLHHNRGNARINLGNFVEAIMDFDKAIELNPQNTNAYYGRGFARLYLKQYKEALADNDKAIRLNPRFVSAFLNRGNAKKELGDRQGAIADFNEAIRLKPQDFKGYLGRGLVYVLLKEHEKARADLEYVSKSAKRQGNQELVQEIQKILNQLPPSD